MSVDDDDELARVLDDARASVVKDLWAAYRAYVFIALATGAIAVVAGVAMVITLAYGELDWTLGLLMLSVGSWLMCGITSARVDRARHNWLAAHEWEL